MNRAVLLPLCLAMSSGGVSVAAADPAPAAGATTRYAFTFDGLEREALARVPKSAKSGAAVVVVFDHTLRTADDAFLRSSWAELADKEGFIVVAPQGVGKQWNDGRGDSLSRTVSTADDVRFIQAAVRQIATETQASLDHVYVTGVSNGGMMTMRLACEAPTFFKAAAPVIARLPNATANACREKPPMPALFINGTADPLITYDGSPPTSALVRDAKPLDALDVPGSVDFWRVRNRCSEKTSERRLRNVYRKDGSTVTRIAYEACDSGAPVVLLRVDGGGHQQPSLRSYLKPAQAALVDRALGPQNHDIDGPAEIWAFFKAQK